MGGQSDPQIDDQRHRDLSEFNRERERRIEHVTPDDVAERDCRHQGEDKRGHPGEPERGKPVEPIQPANDAVVHESISSTPP
jgi:hypothetical protein